MERAISTMQPVGLKKPTWLSDMPLPTKRRVSALRRPSTTAVALALNYAPERAQNKKGGVLGTLIGKSSISARYPRPIGLHGPDSSFVLTLRLRSGDVFLRLRLRCPKNSPHCYRRSGA